MRRRPFQVHPNIPTTRPTRPWDLKLGIHQGRITKTALTPQAPQTGSSKGGDLPPPSPWRVPGTKPKNRAPGGHLPIMYLQINAESAAASTRKGRVQPGAPISGMPGRGSCSSKPAKQVPDPDASPARIPLHGRKTEARRGVCDGPQGPEKTPPALALGREGTRPAHSQVDGWTLVLGRRKSRKASEEEEVQRTLLVWGVTQDTPAQRVRARLSHARAISIDAEVGGQVPASREG